MFLDFSVKLKDLQNQLDSLQMENMNKMIKFIVEIHECQEKVEEKIKNKVTLIRKHFKKYQEAVCFLQIIADFPTIHKEAIKELYKRLNSKEQI
jgi:hypothetical protein